MLELDDAVMMVREILASNPEYAPEGSECRYFDPEGNPDCVVGHVFQRIGISERDLRFQVTLCRNPNTSRFDLLGSAYHKKISPRAAGFLTDVQEKQDHGYSWGDIIPLLDGFAEVNRGPA